MPCEQRAELAHLVPEDREVAMVDVEVVVLDVGEDRRARARGSGRTRPALGSGSRARYSAVIRSRSATSASRRPGDRLTRLEPLDVRAIVASGSARVVDPRAVVAREPVPVGEVEPWLLRRVEAARATAPPPRSPASAARSRSSPPPAFTASADAELERELGEALELLVRAQRRAASSPDTILAIVWSAMSGKAPRQSS